MSSLVENADGSVTVQVTPLKAVISETFLKLGCSELEATRIAERLAGANLRGHDSHGVIRAPRYANYIVEGTQIPNVTVDINIENETLAVIDGKFGFGQTVGEQAVDIGIKKALNNGIAITALQNSGHLGRIGDWAERAAEKGLVSIHMVNVRGSLIVAPFGGIDRRMSTSPFCAGIPLDNGDEPIILDMATSVVAEGKALVALKGGKPLPEDAIVSEDGTITGDPKPLYGDTKQGMFPNPNNGSFDLMVPQAISNATVEILDLSGKVILCEKLNSNKQRINLNLISRGVYIVSLNQNGSIKTEKLIIK